ncbi:hypothetical protein D9758_010832 [Tetrapyrgos nigripes]|uniref:Xylanolytic transcriptional activator regulatory domain-containing protein n=1 Tax=Tetrapyrgos nigripes TaxID=182062 RepID=A0A8H5GI65_9AGAR|nr:hypothetical protein D9758_010832 [Tetrapyrgos nigripes]
MSDNICIPCLKLGIACTHVVMQQKRGPKTGTVWTSTFQPVDILVEQILNGPSSRPFTIPDSKESVRKILVKLAKRIRELKKDQQPLDSHDNSILGLRDNTEAYNFTPSAPIDTRVSKISDNGQETDSNVEDLSKELSQFSFGRERETHFGESSNIMLMKVAMEHNKELHGPSGPDWNSILARVRRPEFWEIDPVSEAIFSSSNAEYNASIKEPSYLISQHDLDAPVYNFPAADDLHRFIDIYFIERETYTPLLHRPSFEKSIREGLHHCDSAFGAVVLAVCAHGAKLLSSSRQEEPGDRWFRQIHLRSFVFKQDLELYHLQLYCLMMTYFYGAGKGAESVDNAWVLAGIAIRRAQEKGVHRRRTSSSQYPTVEGELWKRAFWMLTLLDTMMSAYYGRPRATSVQDFDLDPLIECDDEYWEPQAEDGHQGFVQPPGKPSKLAYWNAYMRLIEIYGFALVTIVQAIRRMNHNLQSKYSVRKNVLGSKIGIGNGEWYEKAMMAIDSALNEWMGLVPEHLQWDKQHDDPIFFTQSTLLFSWYHWIQIAVHRRFIPRPRNRSTISLPSLAICISAARSSLRVCERFTKRLGNYHPQLVLVMYHSATVLALNLVRSLQLQIKIDPRKEIMDIYKFIDLLRFYERATIGTTNTLGSMPEFNHPAQQPPTAQLQAATSSQPSLPLSSTSEIGTEPSVNPNIEGWSSESIQQLSSMSATSYTTTNSLLPSYSGKLGRHHIHEYSVNESSFASFDSPSANMNTSSLISPDLQEYFSLFDESTMVNTKTNNTVGDTPQSCPSTTQDWDSFMASIDQLLG